MINEQIKIEISRQVESQFTELKKSFELLNLPLISQYKVLAWAGTANGALLAPQFDINILLNRIITIKSFRIVPYYPPGIAVMTDVFLNDGVTQTVEVIPNSMRINRIFDDNTQGTGITFRINQNPVLFDTLVALPLPLDLWLDNVYYKHPTPVSTLDVAVQSVITTNLQTLATANPAIKVYAECYLQ